MNKSRRFAGEKLVAQTEKSLREAIIEFMENSPNSGGALLINSLYFPSMAQKDNLLCESEALAESASSCIELRVSLGLPLVGSVGKLYLDASLELSNSEQHLNNPAPLCEALLRAVKGKI
jgi:hypothetical protein